MSDYYQRQIGRRVKLRYWAIILMVANSDQSSEVKFLGYQIPLWGKQQKGVGLSRSARVLHSAELHRGCSQQLLYSLQLSCTPLAPSCWEFCGMLRHLVDTVSNYPFLSRHTSHCPAALCGLLRHLVVIVRNYSILFICLASLRPIQLFLHSTAPPGGCC